MINAVNFQQNRFDDIVADQFKPRVSFKMNDVDPFATEEIIEADNFVPVPQQAFTQMGPEKAGTAGNQCAHSNLRVQKFYGIAVEAGSTFCCHDGVSAQRRGAWHALPGCGASLLAGKEGRTCLRPHFPVCVLLLSCSLLSAREICRQYVVGS
jgi:hypothetical protein